jgi:hypothetical protein
VANVAPPTLTKRPTKKSRRLADISLTFVAGSLAYIVRPTAYISFSISIEAVGIFLTSVNVLRAFTARKP